MTYAKTTTVSTSQSEIQIKGILKKHGATGIMIGENEEVLAIQFAMKNRQVRFVVPFPSLEDHEIKFTDGGKIRTQAAAASALQQSLRQRFRLLFLVVKAKLEAVDSGVVTFEEEFLAHTVMSDGNTVGDWARPQIASMYETGNMPPLLEYGG